MYTRTSIVGLLAALFATSLAQSPSPAPQSQSAPARPATAVSNKAAPAVSTPAAQTGVMAVKRAAIALDIVDREPRDTGTVFPPEVKRLYCFTEIGNGEGREIQHRWYWNDDLINTVSLNVTSNRHRTYSAKTIPAGMTGEWRVAIVDSRNEAVLHMVNFTVK
ncbi:MAG: DUF2914 domain-containing protein [Chitinispirillaceae bacterium]|nr:DUF2914 domain-containing protein [Chitinispirillaceae bacterium]